MNWCINVVSHSILFLFQNYISPVLNRATLLLLLLLLCALQAQLPPLRHTWSDMAGHQKINLFPLHLFKTLLICCLPIKGLPFREEPIGSHLSSETQANPGLHSNVAYLYQGATPFPDTAYLWYLKRGPAGGTCLYENTEICVQRARPRLQIWDYHRPHCGWEEVKGESEEFICCYTVSDVVATLANSRDFAKIASSALNNLNIWGRWVWSQIQTSPVGERTPCGPVRGLFLPGSYWMCYWDLEAELQHSPWIQTSRGLSCSTTAWTNSPRTSRHQCASTQCPTLSTSSTRASIASCRQGPLTASATSWAAPWWGWAPPPPCCPDTPPWGGSAPPSPTRPCTTTEITTPTWAASPSPAPSAPWRVAVWAAGRRAAVTGEEGGSSAPTVSLNTADWTQHPDHQHITTSLCLSLRTQ